MRIVFFISNIDLGGAEQQALFLAEHLHKRGYEIKVLVFGKQGYVLDKCQDLEIDCLPITLFFSKKDIVKSCYSFLQMWQAFLKLKPDIVFSYCLKSNVWSAILWSFTSAKYCVWTQLDAGLGSNILKIFKNVQRLPTHYISNSNAGVTYLQSLGVSSSIYKIANIVSLPMPVYSRSVWREKLFLPQDAILFCMVANLTSGALQGKSKAFH